MKLTPAVLEAAYDFLQATPPFRRWRMPPGVEVTFRVGRRGDELGSYQWDPQAGLHVIGISAKCIGRTESLVMVMAHEMVHLYQRQRGTFTSANHNAEFCRLGKLVCRHHGFDPLLF